MAHIVSFVVDGLAGRTVPISIDLDPKVNVFFGQNGSGKTSLLKILNSAMSNDASLLEKVPFTSAEVEIYSISLKRTLRRKIKKTRSNREDIRVRSEYANVYQPDLFNFQERRGAALKWSDDASLPEDARGIDYHHCYLPTSRLHIGANTGRMQLTGESRSRRNVMTEDELDIFFAKSLSQLWITYNNSVLTGVRIAQDQGLTGILETVLTEETRRKKPGAKTLPAEEAYERVLAFLKRQKRAKTVLGNYHSFEKRYQESPTLQDVVRDIDLVERKIEGITSSRNDLQNLITSMFSGNKKIEFTDQSIEVKANSGEPIGIETLSSGEKHLLNIFINALIAADCSLIIDEPEISMHVDWQRELVSTLRVLNPRAQLIIATHSPEIMAKVSEEHIFRLP